MSENEETDYGLNGITKKSALETAKLLDGLTKGQRQLLYEELKTSGYDDDLIEVLNDGIENKLSYEVLLFLIWKNLIELDKIDDAILIVNLMNSSQSEAPRRKRPKIHNSPKAYSPVKTINTEGFVEFVKKYLVGDVINPKLSQMIQANAMKTLLFSPEKKQTAITSYFTSTKSTKPTKSAKPAKSAKKSTRKNKRKFKSGTIKRGPVTSNTSNNNNND